MATLLVKFTDEKQYNDSSKTITYSDPTPKRWENVFSKIKHGDNCIFHSSNNKLFIGEFSSSNSNVSITFSNIQIVYISLDDLLRINTLLPETLAEYKRPSGPIYREDTINVSEVFDSAKSKKFISFYIVVSGQEASMLPSFSENDRVVMVDISGKIIDLYSVKNSELVLLNLPGDYFKVKGYTLDDLKNFILKSGKKNHLRNINRVLTALSLNKSYKFPSFNDYYNIMHNKKFFGSLPLPYKIDIDSMDSNEAENGKTSNDISLNTILYGPPGTGKTFHTVSYAVSIIDNQNLEELKEETSTEEGRRGVKDRFDELVQSGNIVFTTFHQTLSYEDFIEGIKPLEPTADGSISYEVADGLFKMFCNEAKKSIKEIKKDFISFEDALEQLEKEWNTNKNMTFSLKKEGKNFTLKGFNEKNIPFRKAGGSECHSLSIKSLRAAFIDPRILDSHGLKNYFLSVLDKLKTYKKINQFQDLTHQDRPSKFVFIIDEINRGNVSQIFGELITLIEPDKRIDGPEEIRVILPYSKEPFGVPGNIYIVGTMNTADRSVEALDTALRRRFSFEPIMPDETKLGITDDGINLSAILYTLNERLRVLKDYDHTIGHAWLWNVKDVEGLKRVFASKILPLLQEYFYNDYEKLGLLLGNAFFKKQEQVSSDIFAPFKGGNHLAGQYEQSWQYELKPVSDLTIKDFNTLEILTNKPYSDETA